MLPKAQYDQLVHLGEALEQVVRERDTALVEIRQMRMEIRQLENELSRQEQLFIRALEVIRPQNLEAPTTHLQPQSNDDALHFTKEDQP